VRLFLFIFLGGVGLARAESPAPWPGSCTAFPTGTERSFVNQGISKVAGDGVHFVRTDENGAARLGNFSTSVELPVEGSGELRLVEFSPDSTRLLVGWSSGALQVRDVLTKVIFERALPEEISLAVFSPDGKSLLVGDKAGTYQVFEIGEGKKIGEGKHPHSLLSAAFSPDGKTWVTTSSGPQAWIEQADASKKVEVMHGGGVDRASFSPDGKHVFTGSRDNIARVLDTETGKEVFQVPHRHWVKDVRATQDGALFISSGADGIARITELASGIEVAKVAHTGEVTEAQVSEDGRWLATSGAEAVVKIVSLPKGKEHLVLRHVDRITSLAFSADGRFLGLGTRDGFAKLVEVQTGKGVSSTRHGAKVGEVGFSRDGKWFYSVSAKKLLSQQVDPLCVADDMKFFAAKNELTEGRAIHAKIRESLCAKPYEEAPWNQVTPDMSGIALPQATAKSFLLRFQKPEGFRAERHLRVLLAILRSEWKEKEIDLVGGALQTVAAQSPQLYAEIFQRLPELTKAKQKPDETLQCRTDTERAQVQLGAQYYLGFLRRRNQGKLTAWGDWASLQALSPLLSGLPEKMLASVTRDMARSLGEGAAEQPALKGISPDRLGDLALESVKPLFGFAKCERTELLPLWSADRLTLLALATAPFDESGESVAPYGVFEKSLGSFPYADVTLRGGRDLASLGVPAEIAWSVKGQKYVGRLSAQAAENATEQGPALTWEAVRKEALAGAIVVGAETLEAPNAIEVADRYLNYLRQEEFELGPAKESEDLVTALENGVKKGGLDYLAVEGGWPRGKTGWIFEGMRKVAEGKNESLSLFIAKPGRGAATADLGAWVSAREGAGGGPLLYLENFHGSSSFAGIFSKPGLIAVFPAGRVTPFANTPANAFRSILQSVRAGKTFAEMREAANALSEPASRQENIFLFPDEPGYQRALGEKSSLVGGAKVEMFRQELELTPYLPEKACEAAL